MRLKLIKTGVIGVGHLGRFHTKMYGELENAELIGVFDKDTDRAHKIASEFGTKAYASLDDLLRQTDAVSIAVPTQKHFEIAKQALAADNHIFLEKPVTVTVAEGEELVSIAKSKNLVFQVGHIERFNPAIMALKELKIDPLFIESHRLAGFTPRGADVAVVLDLMIHDLDLILALVNSEVQNIEATGAAIISDTEDIANCRIEFANGCVANITASRISAKKMRKMRIFQKDAYFSIDFDQGKTEAYFTNEANFPETEVEAAMSLGQIDLSEKKREIHYTTFAIEKTNALMDECSEFLNCISTQRTPLVDGSQGVKALKVANSILDIIARKREKVTFV
jgi:predicted dehydrogenase